MSLEFEWDEAKRRETLDKRKLDFASVVDFEWATALIRPSARRGESRWAAIGYIGNRLYHVVWTERGQTVRIISLRKANAREALRYVEGQG